MRPAGPKKNCFRAFVLAIALCNFLIAESVPALPSDIESVEYLPRVWQSEDGLPENSVQAITQTKDGYLWVGTGDGLARFNGSHFITFNRKNTPKITAAGFMSFFVEENDVLWMGLEAGGLVRMQDGKFTHYILGDLSKGNFTERIRAIAKSRDGTFWLGTGQGLVAFKDGRTVTNYTFGPGFVNNSIKSMVMDGEETFWMATGGGLVRAKDGKFFRFTANDGLSDNNLRVLLFDRDGVLWIGGAAGLTRFKDNHFKVYTMKDGLSDNNIRSIFQDREGQLWIGTQNGLNRMDGERFATVKGARFRDMILSIFEDQEGNLWIGTNDGIKRLRVSRFRSFTVDDGLPYHSITSVLEDRENNLWIGSSGGGLYKYSDGKFTAYTKRDGLSSDSILALHLDHAGTLWVGTDGAGVNQVKDGKIIPFSYDLPSPTVRAICEDRQQRLWVGTYSGLQPYNEKAFLLYNPTNRGEHYIVRALCSTSDGALWIGTHDGLDRLIGTNLVTFRMKQGLSGTSITDMYEDKEGVLWIAHDGGGLTRYKNGTFTAIKPKSGLSSDIFFSIVEDLEGNLWMSYSRGIFRVSKKDLNDFADGRIASFHGDSFDRSDGMIRTECTGAAQPSAWRDHNGNLWFANSKGLVMTSPSRIRRNTLPPPVHIEQVLYDDKPISLTPETELKRGKEKLEFHCAALSFMAPGKVHYKFKLEGYEDDWEEAGTRHIAYYSNLHPGDYTFRVIACNSDGVWNETGAAVSFSIVPPWYESTLFYSFGALGLILATASLFRLRVRRLKQREAQLVKHSNELQEEIFERKHAQTQMAAFSNLGQKLNAATSVSAAAKIIADIADQLLSWDACSFLTYSAEKYEVRFALQIDTVDGQRINMPIDSSDIIPSPMVQRVLRSGSQLILREGPELSRADGLTPFGNKDRRSASLIFVPVRIGEKVIGVLTIQSYRTRAYNLESVKTLEALASHCGGAIERITTQEALRAAHDELETRVEERTAQLSKVNQALTQEISERERAEGALIKSESQLRLIWDNSLDGMRLLDENGNFVMVNEAYCRLVGKSKDQLVGQPISIVFDPNRGEEILRKHRDRFHNRTFPRLAEKQELLWNGKKIYLEVSNSYLQFQGEAPRLLTTVRDITDRKRLEEQARQSQKMESIGQLAAGIAHDFNNLLTVIQGHTSLLAAKETDREDGQSLKEISEAAERAANLTRQLLAFSRKQVMQAKPLDLNEVIAHVGKMLRRLLGEHIDLQLHYATNLPAIHADTGMMEQIIMNIAVNARDAMPKGGQLKITTRAVNISESNVTRNTEARVGPAVCLSITDTGCGMDPATLGKIFEPFFTTKEVGRGTGLGLATVYGIVKQHQGWVEVESQLGKGTTFKIFFPALQSAAAKPSEVPSKLQAAGGKETLLVVEDEAPLRLLTQRVLQRYGYRVLVAESGVAALKVWRDHQLEIDLLLTDMMMPEGLSGRDLADKLHADRPTLKVIYSSGYSEELLGDNNAMSQEFYFLPKPYAPVTLAQIVRDCLDNRRREKPVPAF